MRLSAFRERLGHVVRVDVTVRLQIRGANDTVEIDERKELGRSLGRDDLERDTQRVGNTFPVTKFVESLLGSGESHATAPVIVDRLSRLRFERLIEFDAVLEKLHHVEARVELCAESCGMPCRTAGQLVLLHEDGIGEPELCQVVKQAATGNTASNDDDSRFPLHTTDRMCALPSSMPREYTRGYSRRPLQQPATEADGGRVEDSLAVCSNAGQV